MKDTAFINYIEIHGEEVKQKELSGEQKKEIANLLSDCFMKAAGFVRRGQEEEEKRADHEKR